MSLLHEEFNGVVTEVHSWGIDLMLENGTAAFLDNTKNPWVSKKETPPFGRSQPPGVGDSIRVLVLDDERTPIRVSALGSDFEIGRAKRDG